MVTLGQTNGGCIVAYSCLRGHKPGCIIEGDLLTEVYTSYSTLHLDVVNRVHVLHSVLHNLPHLSEAFERAQSRHCVTLHQDVACMGEQLNRLQGGTVWTNQTLLSTYNLSLFRTSDLLLMISQATLSWRRRVACEVKKKDNLYPIEVFSSQKCSTSSVKYINVPQSKFHPTQGHITHTCVKCGGRESSGNTL